MIKKTWRPPNFETPVSYFNEAFTPNDAFFVRYHLADIPEVAPQDWRLQSRRRGAGQALRARRWRSCSSEFEAVEINAVCQCSGNRRGLVQPARPGRGMGLRRDGQRALEGRAAQGRAGARGTPARKRSRSSSTAPTVAVLDKTPDFVKSIPVWKAMDENTLLAYEMNGEPLPHWNGYPVRLVVPGWTATYWMKHVTIDPGGDASRSRASGWRPAYRIPKGKFPIVDRFLTQETEANTPITEMVVNSLITNLHPGQRFAAGQTIEVKGVAWDGGFGIATVEVSQDGGAHLAARASWARTSAGSPGGSGATSSRPHGPAAYTIDGEGHQPDRREPDLRAQSSTPPATTTTWCSGSTIQVGMRRRADE